MRAVTVLLSVLLVAGVLVAVPGGAAAHPAPLPAAMAIQAPAADLPSHSSIVTATKLAADYYRPTLAHPGIVPTNGWSWSTYAAGIQQLYRTTGDARYLADGLAWGRANNWQLTTAESNPDTINAGKTYTALHALDPTASTAAIEGKMAADLTSLPLSQYDWADALFMGLPNWAQTAARTGNIAYLDKMDALYAWARDSGATGARCAGQTKAQPGLFDATTGLWFRDCRYVGAPGSTAPPVFWGRGNGWAIAAMAEVVRSLPAGDPRGGKYADMLRTMAARLVQLQGSDGMWRSNLVNTNQFPQPETSGTALISYAMATGISLGVLDVATYRPAVAAAWRGLASISLQPSGFVTGCQPQGIDPAAPYPAPAPRTAPTSTSSGTVNVDSQPFCVGAVLLAGSAVAALVPPVSTGRPVTASAQQVGSESPRLVDGDVTTRWSANGFPQSATVDLGSATTIGNAMVIPYQDRAYRYRVETSTDNVRWQLVIDRTANVATGTAVDDVIGGAVSARYVRLTVTGVGGAVTTWSSIQEFAVYPPPTTTPVLAADAFGRTVPAGFGAADSGGSWVAAGSGTPLSVSGGAGRIRLAAAGSGAAVFLTSLAAADVDARVDAVADRSATGIYVALAGRRIGSDDYRAKVKWTPNGAATLSVMRVIGGAEAVVQSLVIPGLTSAATVPVTIRLQLAGRSPTTLRAKVWLTGTVEPIPWQLTATDSAASLQGPGGIGVWSYLSSTATNAPVTVSVDNLTVRVP